MLVQKVSTKQRLEVSQANGQQQMNCTGNCPIYLRPNSFRKTYVLFSSLEKHQPLHWGQTLSSVLTNTKEMLNPLIYIVPLRPLDMTYTSISAPNYIEPMTAAINFSNMRTQRRADLKREMLFFS